MTEILLYRPSLITNGFFDERTDIAWSQAGTGTFTIEDGYIQHNNDGAASFSQDNVLMPTKTYRVKLKITSLNLFNSVTVDCGGGTQTFTVSGTFQADIASFGTEFKISVTSGANCKISNISVVESPGSYSIDSVNKISFPITYAIDDLRNPEKRTTNFSKTINVPGTKNNNQIFGEIYEISGESSFNPNKQCRCVVLNEGIEVFRGVLCLNNINRSNVSGINNYNDISFDCTLLGTLGNIFNRWGNMTIAELDFSEYNHVFSRDNVYQSWYGIIQKNGGGYNNFTETYSVPGPMPGDSAIAAMNSISFQGQDRVQITFTTTHAFNIGDEVFGFIVNNNLLNGMQTVVDITSTSITLNLLWSALTNTTLPAGTFTNYQPKGEGYVYPMIDMGTVNGTAHEDDPMINESLVVGISYIIKDYVPGDDFTNVGALSNADGVMFTATGTTPTTWSNGTTIISTDVANWRVDEFYPAIFVKEILDKSFKAIGYNYNSDLISSAFFKRLIVPFSNGDAFKLSQKDINPLLFKAIMADTGGSPNGHTWEHKYNLYPYPSISPYNQGVGLGAQYRFLSVNATYSNNMFGTLGYDASGNPGGGGGFGIGADIFVKGVTYEIISKLGSDDFTNAGAPSNANGTIWVSTVSNNAAGAGVTWTGQSVIKVHDPWASHHLICQNPTGCTAILIGEVPCNKEVYDYGNNYNTTNYQYTQPAGYPPVTHTFYFSGVCWNYVKDFYAYNGVDGDMPSDYAGTGAPGIYSLPTRNGKYIGGIGKPVQTLPAAEESEYPVWNPFNVIVFEKSVDGVTWTSEKFLSAANPLTGDYSTNRWEETTIAGSCDITLNAGDRVRMRYRANTKIVAIRSDGHPCIGASAGGTGGGGVGPGNVGGPVQMTLRIDNAQFFNKIKEVKIREGLTVPYDFNTVLPTAKISDFFLSIIKAFNLLVDIDKKDDKLLQIETRDEYYDPTNPLDWTDKLNVSSNISIKPMGDLNAKTYIYKYKEGADTYNADYKTDWGGFNNRTYGDKIFTVNNDFVKDENKVELIFNPSPIVGPDTAYRSADRVISSIYTIDNQNLVKPIKSLNLMFYNIRGTDYQWNLISTLSGNINDIRYPYFFNFSRFYPQAIHLDNHLTPGRDLNFDIPLATYYTATVYTENNLFNVYHKKFIEEITDRHSKIVEAEFYLTPKDITTLDFRKLILVDGHLLRLKTIIDYDVNGSGLTKCEFIKVKAIT